jgi:hypothetical protein
MGVAGRKRARKNAGALRRSGEEALREMKNVEPTTENGKLGTNVDEQLAKVVSDSPGR